MNKVNLIGRLTKDPEIKMTSNATTFCAFTIAVDRHYKDADGNRQADFINCIAWRQTAEFLKKYFSKGSRLAVCGSIQTRSYEDTNGEKKFATEVIVDEVEFVESNNSKRQQEEEQQPETKPQPAQQQPAGELPFEI